MSSQTLTTIEQDLDVLDALLADLGGDISEADAEAAIDAWFAELGEQRDAKLNGYARRIQMLRMYAYVKREEEKRLAAQRKANERDAEWLEGRLLRFVQERGTPIRGKETRQVETDLFRFVETKNGGKQALTYLVPPEDLPQTLRTDVITIHVYADHEEVYRIIHEALVDRMPREDVVLDRTAKPVEERVRAALEQGSEEITRFVRLEPRGVRLAIR